MIEGEQDDRVVLSPRPERRHAWMLRADLAAVALGIVYATFGYLSRGLEGLGGWMVLAGVGIAGAGVLSAVTTARQAWDRVELGPEGVRLLGGRLVRPHVVPWSEVAAVTIDPPGGSRRVRLTFASGRQQTLPVREDDVGVVGRCWDTWGTRRDDVAMTVSDDAPDTVLLAPRPFRGQQWSVRLGVAILVGFNGLLLYAAIRGGVAPITLVSWVCGGIGALTGTVGLARHQWQQVELTADGIRVIGGRWTPDVAVPWSDVRRIGLDPPGGRRRFWLSTKLGGQQRLPVRDEDRHRVVEYWQTHGVSTRRGPRGQRTRVSARDRTDAVDTSRRVELQLRRRRSRWFFPVLISVMVIGGVTVLVMGMWLGVLYLIQALALSMSFYGIAADWWWTRATLTPRGIDVHGPRIVRDRSVAWSTVTHLSIDPPGGHRIARLSMSAGVPRSLFLHDEDAETLWAYWRAHGREPADEQVG